MNLECPAKDDETRIQNSTNRTVEDSTDAIIPRQGRLVVLRTKAEVEKSGLQTTPAYVIEIPQTSASDVLRYVHTSYFGVLMSSGVMKIQGSGYITA